MQGHARRHGRRWVGWRCRHGRREYGGGDATPILVTTAEQLKQYLADDQPRVLYLMNDLDFRTAPRDVSVCADDTTCDNGSGVQVDSARVSATCDAGEHKTTRQRNEQLVE